MAPIVTSLASIVKQFGIGALVSSAGGGTGLTATGGVISDYTDPGPGNIYRAHIFTSSGTFDVTAPGTFGDTVDVLAVAGGGGGAPSPVSGSVAGGGGGGGGLVYKPGHSVSVAPYTITVGGGGAPNALVGGFSAFGDDAASPFPATSLIAIGGGVGARGPNVTSGNEGGSGGGGDDGVAGSPGIQGTSPNPRSIPADSVTYGFGNPGGQGNGTAPGYNGGGGGGAGGAGGAALAGTTGAGGVGKQYLISGPPATTQPIGTPGPNPGGGYFAGGGSGGYRYAPITVGTAGAGGGGAGNGAGGTATPGTFATGGGGGGSGNGGLGGSGGSGIIVVRYQIGQLTATAKATGGAISYYGGKTIHTFTSSGTFATAPNWTATNVEYVVVAGGGSGGSTYHAGGGGAGGYLDGTTPIGTHPVSVSIQVGAGAAAPSIGPNVPGTQGTPSYFGAPITATGGGGGGSTVGSAGPGGSGGSGGGGSGFSGSGGSATSGQGYAGGTGGLGPWSTSGGGGGAGGAGTNGSGPYPDGGAGPNAPATAAGVGGLGRQVPATFRNPTSRVGAPGPTGPVPGTNPGGDTSGLYWFAGGGGGNSGQFGGPGGGKPYPWTDSPINDSSFAGGGAGNKAQAGSGLQSTGGGGGGSERNYPVSSSTFSGGSGGSGIVLIAYPS